MIVPNKRSIRENWYGWTKQHNLYGRIDCGIANEVAEEYNRKVRINKLKRVIWKQNIIYW